MTNTADLAATHHIVSAGGASLLPTGSGAVVGNVAEHFRSYRLFSLLTPADVFTRLRCAGGRYLWGSITSARRVKASVQAA